MCEVHSTPQSLEQPCSSTQKDEQPGFSGVFRASPKVVLLFFCLLLCNILLLGDVANTAVTLVEIAVVLYFLARGRIDQAILWHFMFTMMSMDATNALLDNDNSVVYNYSGMKLIGPVRVSYVISILFFLVSMHKSFKLKGLLYKLLLFIMLIAFIGSLFFLYGAFFADYYIKETVGYYVYLGMACCNLIILLKNLTPYLLKALPFYLFNLLIASPMATFVGWAVFHHVTSYSGVPGLIQADIDYLAPALLFFAIQKETKGKLFLYASLCCLLCNLSYAARGGALLIFVGCCALFVFTLFFTSRRKEVSVFVKIGIVLVILFGAVQVYEALFTQDFALSLSKIKMRQVLSLFTSFSATGLYDVKNIMGNSPFVRFAELVDSFYENSHNLLHFLFGKGYGSFITDELNLMQDLNLEKGGYSYEQVMSGRYFRLHGTLPSVMLIHGLFGIVGFFCFVFAYLRKITISPFAFAALIWLGMSFYFNYQCATYGMAALLACDIAVAHRDGLISDSGVLREKKQD